jgi:hypothetical protein
MKNLPESSAKLCNGVSRQDFFNIHRIKASCAAAFFAVVIFFVATGGHSQSTATMMIQAGQSGVTVSSNLFGIFFEEINYAGDGGLYGEMVRNRSFAESASPNFWTLATSGTAAGTISVDTSLPLNTNNLASLNLTMSSGTGTVGAVNAG